MKVIFLDVDGVLNFYQTEAVSPQGYTGIASQPLKHLRKIVKATGARIVLCSTWRKGWNFNEEECSADGKYLISRLKRFGLHILDKTEDGNDAFRGTAIKKWLDKHPHVQKWIVLDDEIFVDYIECGIIPHLVQTNFYAGGLSLSHVEKSISLLGASDSEEKE